jgi:hypothetical protein
VLDVCGPLMTPVDTVLGSRTQGEHALQHSKEKSHPVVVDRSWTGWCYACDRWLNRTDLDHLNALKEGWCEQLLPDSVQSTEEISKTLLNSCYIQ